MKQLRGTRRTCAIVLMMSSAWAPGSAPPDIEPVSISGFDSAPPLIDPTVLMDYGGLPSRSRPGPAPARAINFLWQESIPITLDTLGRESQFLPFLERTIPELERYTRTMPDDPNGWTVLGVRLFQTNRLEESIAALAMARRADSLHERSAEMYSAILIHSGNLDRAMPEVRRMLDELPHNRILRFNAACGYSLAGNHDEAMYHLETLTRLEWTALRFYLEDPDLDAVRRTPAFARLQDRIEREARVRAVETIAGAAMNTVVARLKPGRDKPVTLGHPWIFSGAVASWSAPPQPGQAVDVVSANNEWIGRGLADPPGNVSIRIYTRNEADRLDDEFFAGKLRHAIAWRESVIIPMEPGTDSFRLCFSESDGLSGLIVDRYAEVACLVINAPVLNVFVPVFREVVTSLGLQPLVVMEGDESMRPAIPRRVKIMESSFTYEVDLAEGQKTGFYLDQRVNRRRVAAYARSRRVLSAYCYTGGFETHLANAGAGDITGLDRSEAAIESARRHLKHNAPQCAVNYLVADVPGQLRRYRDNRDTFDLIVLDPPKFVHHEGQIEKGLRAYKDINLLAMKLLTPGGILATFSCSGWIKRDRFLTALEWAARDAGRDAQILETFGQPPDHPVLLAFPESDYLCGYLLRVV